MATTSLTARALVEQIQNCIDADPTIADLPVQLEGSEWWHDARGVIVFESRDGRRLQIASGGILGERR